MHFMKFSRSDNTYARTYLTFKMHQMKFEAYKWGRTEKKKKIANK